jgi:hypothetical protein
MVQALMVTPEMLPREAEASGAGLCICGAVAPADDECLSAFKRGSIKRCCVFFTRQSLKGAQSAFNGVAKWKW